MRIILCMLFGLLGLQAQGQFRFSEDRTVPVSINGSELARPWEGGINSAQYQKTDLNNDGVEDLVIFHRMTETLTTYLALENEFVFSPEYVAFFPEEVSDWLVMADYNCDGLKDIFTSTPLGIKVFENTSSGDDLSWTESVDFIIFNDDINLQVNASDIPGIADIDGDGDLDILSYRFSSSSTIDYYRNMSVENTGGCGELVFTREIRRWGGIEECDCGSFAFGETCAELGGVANPQDFGPSTESVEHAGGKTILPIDIDNDGDMDLITSDEFCETLYLMENKGNAQLAAMTEFQSFPVASPAAFYIFPSAFYEDIDFDGTKDLIISTNADNNIGNRIDFTATSRFATNEGSNELPVFANSYSAFLQSEMIDLGETTYPTFADVDGDSDLDMIVGTRGNVQNGEFLATLYLFENEGTPLRPAFNLTNDDYLELSSSNFRNLKPQAIDLDGDGDLDLAYQATENNGNRTAIRYRINQGNFSLGNENEIVLAVLENDQYHFANIDGDNQADLLIGSRLGNLTYYQNEGNLSFGEGSDNFGGIDNGFETRTPSILVADLNRDGNSELILTDITGFMKVLEGEMGPDFMPDNTFTALTDHALLSGLQTTRLGLFSPLTAADLFGDGRPAIILGNHRGGLQLYRNLSSNDGGSAGEVRLFAFPNPTNGSLFLQASESGTLEIYTLSGKRIQQGIAISGTEQLEVDTTEMPAGIYLFRVTNGSEASVVKVIIQR